MSTTAVYGGIMSGTSLDGLDGVIVDLGQQPPQVLAQAHQRWPSDLVRRLRQAADGREVTTAEVLQMSQEVSESHIQLGQALLCEVKRSSVAAVGMHGQTVWHRPPKGGVLGYSLQLGSGSWVAARLGIRVVSDFRLADMALGGQGAPLAPYAHLRLFAHPSEIRAVLNLGGIANLTGLLPGQPVWASDVGPANMLMDDLARHYSHGAFDYDPEGMHAARGKNHPELLAHLLADDFFALPFPKSTGRERFGGAFTRMLHTLTWDDASHTAGRLTVEGIARAIRSLPARPVRLIVAGGGVHNAWLMDQLAQALFPVAVESSAAYGVDPLHLEAIAFALLAQARLNGQCANLPSVTGARASTVLGVVADGRVTSGSEANPG